MPPEREALGICTLRFYLRAEPIRSLGDGAAIQGGFCDSGARLRNYQQGELDKTDTNAKGLLCWNETGKQTGELREPVETRVAVIRFRREERDGGARCELCGVVQLQTCVRKPGRQIGVNRLPGANTETSSLCRVLGGELHRIDRFEKLYQHTRVRSLSQANDATL